MTKYNKPLLALLIGAMTVVGAAGVASARMGMHGGPHHGAYAGQVTPEMRQMMEKAYADIAPLQLELRAKQQELTAKIYSGADDKTIQELGKEVTNLQARLTQARIKMQQDFAKAGLPIHMGGCPMGGGGMMGHGMGPGMMGPHGGYMHGPKGYHGGPCPGYYDRAPEAPVDGPAGQ